ncbi:MAG: Hpt domain-containing protein [Armatimonadetes bacterium]|jgi:HPt (histidine-containing phosphotransfer) domain-containing protein|nr:Hpt domain-containing protein [Armatimonadota bacterium]HOC30962.1 Hpt domain-containing protein [Armatimonadota bacterium]
MTLKPQTDPVDVEALMEQVDHDPGFLMDLIGIFRESRKSQMDDLSRSVAESDAEGIRRHAHAIKGMLLSLGATASVQTARDLENAGRDNRLREVAVLCETLDSQLDALDDRLWQIAQSMDAQSSVRAE